MLWQCVVCVVQGDRAQVQSLVREGICGPGCLWVLWCKCALIFCAMSNPCGINGLMSSLCVCVSGCLRMCICMLDRDDAEDCWEPCRAICMGTLWCAGASSVFPLWWHGEPLPYLCDTYFTGYNTQTPFPLYRCFCGPTHFLNTFHFSMYNFELMSHSKCFRCRICDFSPFSLHPV